MVDAQTQLVGLIGWPVQHSLSPLMHNAAFAELGLNWCYVPLAVRPGAVEKALRGLAALGFRGSNVTLPHKRTVQLSLDSLATTASRLGAVNTLIVRRQTDGSATIEGHNTDAQGFLHALRHGGFQVSEESRAVIVGAGGGARAVIFGLLQAGVRDIVVLNRTVERAQAVVEDLEVEARLRALALSKDTLLDYAERADLLVNATPVGMWPGVDESIWPNGVPMPGQCAVFDLVYHPLQTRLLQQVRQSGALGIDGLGMLVAQGALSFEMWTGVAPPVEIMRAACEEALRR